MKHTEYTVEATVWLYPGDAAWHFVTIPPDISGDIRDRFHDRSRGWGSLPVEVTVGSTVWNTSIFPDRKAGTYMLPLRAVVRKSEKIGEGDTIHFMIEIKV